MGMSCPNCGRETEFPIFPYISIEDEPRFKDEILSGRLFHFACKECAFETPINYAMLYKDRAKKLLVFLFPGEEDVPKDLDASLNDFEDGWRMRLVRDARDLAETIEIIDHNRDDRTLSVMKIKARTMFREKNPDTTLGTLYYDGEADALQGETEGGAIYFPIKEDEYQKIAEMLAPETKHFLRVDERYAMAIANESFSSKRENA